ncbi:Aste57867_11758 [Aphanomyces stellatus]|uniref:Aste57867_11758 protein n=1 Tax=Aphanomyces stellatus TaxID=120398 RepID=A0A485KU86_9STRA|nr:hypothetical protein As57867_011713 [Aphanomyces stellatus]VFT88614.1 Aste57867_11758 [Aphanomyces stellatus]
MSDWTWDFVWGVQYFLGNDDDSGVSSMDEKDKPCARTITLELKVTPSTPRTAHHTRGRIPTHRKQQLELKSLRRELARLKGYIMDIEIPESREMTYWERVAKMEQLDLLKAGLENEDLLAAVQNNTAFIDNLQRTMRKKRHLADSGLSSN